jgi:hypothetical protein
MYKFLNSTNIEKTKPVKDIDFTDYINIDPPHWKKGDHIHAGGQNHIPINN